MVWRARFVERRPGSDETSCYLLLVAFTSSLSIGQSSAQFHPHFISSQLHSDKNDVYRSELDR